MKKEHIEIMGMPVERWTHKSCSADFGVGDTWATLYSIESKVEGKGHATELLTEAKKQYEAQGKKFGGSVALNNRMKKIYQRLNILEYSE
jgi:hypothetical protein